jgi:hypothetical protein
VRFKRSYEVLGKPLTADYPAGGSHDSAQPARDFIKISDLIINFRIEG